MDSLKEKRCPFCRETIREDATFCRYCNRDLEDADLLSARRRVQRMALFLFAFFGLLVLLGLIASLF